MSLRTLFGRLAGMDREERRFRAACEARKIAGRVRFAAARPRWRRNDLRRLLDPAAGPLVADGREALRRGDALAAHRALAQHFETRGRRWPVAATRRAAFVRALREHDPAAVAEARDRADGIVDGRYDLLGYGGLALGNPPDWHRDRVHGATAPRGYWTTVPFLDPAGGDHKVIWELNRHQHFLALGAAFWFTEDPRYRAAFVAQLEDWLRANPPLDGINWASMLELAFRALSWTWAVEFFCAGAEQDDQPWLVDLLVGLDRQLGLVEHNLSTYFSPNTHLSGEALALYAVSSAFPELGSSAARAAAGRAVLLREANVQVRPDGGHAELSTHYHRYSTDFYLLAARVARLTGDPAVGALELALRAQAMYLRTVADDRGRLPHIGDEDGGQLFRFGGTPAADASPTLSACAAVLEDPSLAVAQAGSDACWILGEIPSAADVREAAASWPSRVLRDTGYFVSRRADRSGSLIFDAGPHGFLNGGHAHADALSVVITVAGEPLLVDPGTPTYTMDSGARDRFRAPAMHNTVTVDDRAFAEPRGPFHWQRTTDAQLLAAQTGGAADFAAAMHLGYGFPHFRAVAAVGERGWLIVDCLLPPRPVRADAWWHLHPAWSAVSAAGGFDLTHTSGLRLTLAATTPDRAIDANAPHAPDYGRTERATRLRTSAAGAGTLVMGMFVPARATGHAKVRLELAPAVLQRPGWKTLTFVLAGETVHRIDLAFPDGDEDAPPAGSWPQPCMQELRAVCVE